MRRLIQLAAPLPALAVGAMVMRHHAIGGRVWGMNLVVGALGLLACAAVRPKRANAADSRWSVAAALVGIVLLAATFVDAGIMGVHRWVPLGLIALYAGAVAVPLVIIGAGALQGRGIALFAVAAAITCAQPDAAQASGLAVGLAVLIAHSPVRGRGVWAGLLAVIALAAWTWLRNDPLGPVPHVEGIVGLAGEAGTLWLAAAVVSLALLPLPFFTVRNHPLTPTTRALGAYVAVCILVATVRNYPFPLLGFGVGPILGYFIALSAVRRAG